MSLLLSILKYIGFALVVLLLGQLPVGDDTLANRFHSEVKNAVSWGEKEWKQSPIRESIEDLKVTSQSKEKPKPVKLERKRVPLPNRVLREGEKITSSDQESLRKLLE